MYHLNVTFSPPKSWITTCGLSTSAGNLLTFFFAVCNNRPVRVIGRAGKRPEITVITSDIPGNVTAEEYLLYKVTRKNVYDGSMSKYNITLVTQIWPRILLNSWRILLSPMPSQQPLLQIFLCTFQRVHQLILPWRKSWWHLLMS